MLTNVPKAVSHAVRQVTLRHPNSFDCSVWRREVKRVELVPGTTDESEAMGMPTLGGMGVLKAEDEADFEYEELGPAKMLLCGIYQPSDLNERDNALLQENTQEVQLEAVAAPGTPGYFLPDTDDLVLMALGQGVVIASTIAKVVGNVNIPPYTRKYLVNPRDDLHQLTPMLG